MLNNISFHYPFSNSINRLTTIGKINIFCGKNNSGKSIILNSINTNGTELIYITNDIINTSINQTNLSDDHKNFISNHLSEKIIGLSIYETDLISKEINEISSNFPNTFNIDYIIQGTLSRRRNFIQEMFLDIQRNIILPLMLENNIRERIILISPKRNMILEVKNQLFTKEINNDGNGLLEYLFFCQNQQVNSKERIFYNTMQNAFHDITEGCNFHTTLTNTGNIRIDFSRDGINWIDGYSSGLGLQDILIIIYFCLSDKYEYILLDEPENHLHPVAQRRLLSFMRKQDKQYFISTHSNIFLDNTLVDKIYNVKYQDNTITITDATRKAEILNDLGYTVADNIAADIIILTEGITDKPVIEAFLDKMGIYSQYDIKIWPLGGDVMDKIDFSIFNHHNLIALIDNDPGSSVIRTRFERLCTTQGISCTRLQRYAIENYFSLRALRQVFPTIDSTINTIDPNTKLQNQIGIDVKKNNRKIAEAMTIEEIQGTDLYQFLQTVQEKLISSKIS